MKDTRDAGQKELCRTEGGMQDRGRDNVEIEGDEDTERVRKGACMTGIGGRRHSRNARR